MTKPTIMKVATRQVILTRDGERYMPKIGKAEPFTADEIKEVAKADAEALRDPNDETAALMEQLQGGSDQEDGSDDGREGKDALDAKTGGDTSGKTETAKKTTKKPADDKTADDEGL